MIDKIDVLGNSFVRYIRHNGSDSAIVDSARISYNGSSKGEEQDKKLLRYLMKNKHCYHPSMQVLTIQGWKKWEECNEYEYFAIPNVDTKKIIFEKLKTLIFEVDNEKMYNYENNRMSYSVTSGHKMWYKEKRFNKSKMKFDTVLVDNMNKWGHFDPIYNYSFSDKTFNVLDPKYQLIGFYLGDGFLSSTNIIGFRLVKDRKLKYLDDILKRLNINYTKLNKGKTSVGNDIYEYKIKRIEVPFIEKYTDLLKTAKHKTFNFDLLIDNNDIEMFSLLDGMVNSDGSIKKDREQIEFSSTSNDIIKLFSLLGSIFNSDCHDAFSKDICKSVKLYKKSRNSLESRKQYHSNTIYNGNVYCTTSSTGFLIVRGKESDFGFICGNSSPLEMVNITFNIRMPIFVMRQFVRTRMFKINEMSARYTKLDIGFYTPDKWRIQDTKNKQGSLNSDELDHVLLSNKLKEHTENSYTLYEDLLSQGVSREMARMVLPVNALTEIIVNCDLSNLVKFFILRDDSHAQYEIQEIARAMKTITNQYFPWTMEIYEELNNK